MTKYVDVTNSAGGQTLYNRDDVSGVEDLMGQTHVLLADGKREMVSQAADQAAEDLGLGHTFSSGQMTIHTTTDRIARVIGSAVGGAEIVLRGTHRYTVDDHVANQTTGILKSL